jgi:hypothetical protein
VSEESLPRPWTGRFLGKIFVSFKKFSGIDISKYIVLVPFKW